MKLLQATTRNRRVAFLILLPAVVSILGVPANAKANEVIEAFENCRSQDLDRSVGSVVAEAQRWRGEAPLGDDLTVLGIEIS